jgi:hypothetical protein
MLPSSKLVCYVAFERFVLLCHLRVICFDCTQTQCLVFFEDLFLNHK